MPRGEREQVDQIILKLREAERELSRRSTVPEAANNIGVTEQTYCRWKKKYCGLRMNQAKRLKDLGKENVKLNRFLSAMNCYKRPLSPSSALSCFASSVFIPPRPPLRGSAPLACGQALPGSSPGPASTAARSFPALRIASASRSVATI